VNKILYISILFLFISGCSMSKKELNKSDKMKFTEELTFEEFSYKLKIYSKVSNYPDLNE